MTVVHCVCKLRMASCFLRFASYELRSQCGSPVGSCEIRDVSFKRKWLRV